MHISIAFRSVSLSETTLTDIRLGLEEIEYAFAIAIDVGHFQWASDT